MAKLFDELSDEHCDFIRSQHIFFTGTAPGAGGRINVSPKGMDTFRVLSHREVGYLDLTGSGNETAAHIEDDGRLTFMFCSLDTKPFILRLYGEGRAVRAWDEEWEGLYSRFEPYPGVRQIIVLTVRSVQTSCGFALPIYTYRGERDTLLRWEEKHSEEELAEYRAKNNARSIDGLPVLAVPPEGA